MAAKANNTLTMIGVSVLLSVIISSAFTYHITRDALDRDKQFKVIDITQLTSVMMQNLESSIREQEVQFSEEMIQVVAQNEAKKLFTTIANTGGEHDIIMPKSSVIYAPSRYEITEQIAEKLGLSGIKTTNIKEALSAVTDDN